MRTAGLSSPLVAAGPSTLLMLVMMLLPEFLSSVRGDLRPQSELTSNCFDFPATNFDRNNSIRGRHGVSPYLPMSAGDDAIDFTLHDTDGQPWDLREALRLGVPVVMIWGMYTCPAFQGLGGSPPFDKNAYWDEFDLVERYKDRATFVHLYGSEPHPALPGTNFDDGTLRQNFWSVVSQHKSYQNRLAMVHKIRALIHPDQLILPDYFPGNDYSDLVQPVWCTYARGARAVTVISLNGKIFFQRAWLQTDHVAQAIEEFWETNGAGRGGQGVGGGCNDDGSNCADDGIPPIS